MCNNNRSDIETGPEPASNHETNQNVDNDVDQFANPSNTHFVPNQPSDGNQQPSSAPSSPSPPPPLPERRPKISSKTPSSDSLTSSIAAAATTPSRPASGCYMDARPLATDDRGSSVEIETETDDDGGDPQPPQPPLTGSANGAASSAWTTTTPQSMMFDTDDWQHNERGAYEDLCYVTFASSQVRKCVGQQMCARASE